MRGGQEGTKGYESGREWMRGGGEGGGAWEELGRGCGPAGREVGKKADEEMDVG